MILMLLIIVVLVINSTSAAILYLRGKPVSGWEPLENISLLAFPPFCYVSTLLENTGNNVDQYAHLFKASNFSKRTHNIGFSQRVTQVWCQQSILTGSSLKDYFLSKRMFDFFDKRDKCRKPSFLRGNIYTSMALLDHFANKSNTFLLPSLSPLSLSHFLLGSPLAPTPATRIPQLKD